MDNKLPTYKISINPALAEDGEHLGIEMVAYTATPAILKKGVAFDGIIRKMVYTDALKYRLAAPGLIPNQLIYREDDDLGAYNVVFTKEMIVQMRNDFMANKRGIVFNLDHNQELEAPSYILEEWITGPSESDRSFTEFGIELPEGSWFVVSQFVDREFFKEEIINKERTGYSVEGLMSLEFETIKQSIKQEQMKKQTFGAKVGDALPLADGEYKLQDGTICIVKDGVIAEVKPAEEPAKEEAPVEAAEEAPVAEEKKEEEVKEEDMAAPAPVEEAPVAEAPVEEAPAPTGTPDEAAILAVVQPKLDELYKVIADLKTLVEAGNVAEGGEEVSEEVAMGSSRQALAAFIKNLNQ